MPNLGLKQQLSILGWGARHTLCVMVFLAYFVNQTMRTCITVAIVAMVRKGEK